MKTIFRIHLPHGVGSLMGSPAAQHLDLNLSDIARIEIIEPGKPPVEPLSTETLANLRNLYPDLADTPPADAVPE